jgi:hypothetical protein
MRRAEKEDEDIIPRISPSHFTKEKSARELDLDTSTHEALMYLKGEWKIIGWALANDVAPRDLCKYVILCEKNGEQIWCHCSNYTIELIAEKIRNEPSIVAPLR